MIRDLPDGRVRDFGRVRRLNPVCIEVATDDVRIVGVLHVAVDGCFELLLHKSRDGASDVVGLLVLLNHGTETGGACLLAWPVDAGDCDSL